ncbi:hypothetical protein EV356DRAFT_530749 [Viridothelium virens]|uniref:Uncharacterized protein n=1 Tax=Viridothelium virens TaxID=1048519 RepID=A0A6A6HG97_VIRVR|nr:hypothetical protein EV356DRAFT_530749 [Viridothelium virens]
MALSQNEHRQKRRRISDSQPYSGHSRNAKPKTSPRLPFSAPELSKHEFDEYKPMFALYLDIQKRLDIDNISPEEAKGRWKSFIKKWNRGELAEGWYDPETKRKALSTAAPLNISEPSTSVTQGSLSRRSGAEKDVDSDEDDEYGPVLPESSVRHATGPAVPSIQDLEMRNEMAVKDAHHQQEDLHYERKMDRKQQKERLDDLVTRAEPGTRERQLEKKREKADQMRSFRDKSPGAPEAGEGEMFGDEGVEAYKAKKQEIEKKKNERELRKEEIWRARAKEREERLEEHKAKEEKTMEMLRALAKERFG